MEGLNGGIAGAASRAISINSDPHRSLSEDVGAVMSVSSVGGFFFVFRIPGTHMHFCCKVDTSACGKHL